MGKSVSESAWATRLRGVQPSEIVRGRNPGTNCPPSVLPRGCATGNHGTPKDSTTTPLRGSRDRHANGRTLGASEKGRRLSVAPVGRVAGKAAPSAKQVARYKANYQRAHRRGSLRAWHWVALYAQAVVLRGEGV